MTQHILIPHQNPTIKAPSLAYLSNVTSNNVEVLKKLHLNLFPVHYSDSFYQQVQNVGEFAKVGKKNSIYLNIYILLLLIITTSSIM